MNYLRASPRGIKKANAQGECGTVSRDGELKPKEIKGNFNDLRNQILL